MTTNASETAIYRRVYLALLGLAAATTALSFVDLGVFSLPAALLIAAAKTALVVLYFMHVRFSSAITKLFSGVAFAFLAILLALTLSDVLSRSWLAPARSESVRPP